MPLFKSDEDLFRESTMTFGEHLEDLRSCLFRAIAGLMVGFILGLIFGISLVHLIQTPLHRALKEYYQRQTEEEKTSELQAAGRSGKESAVAASEFKEFLAKNNLLAEDVYVDRAAIAHAMSAQGQQPGPAIKPYAKMDRADLIKISLFRETEKDRRLEPISLGQTEGFSTYIKASLIFGAVISAPGSSISSGPSWRPAFIATSGTTFASTCPSACCCSWPGPRWPFASSFSPCCGSC